MPQRENAEHRRHRDEDEIEESAPPAVSAESADADVDSILDGIDEVLEVNAEDFVKSFVQKGGE